MKTLLSDLNQKQINIDLDNVRAHRNIDVQIEFLFFFWLSSVATLPVVLVEERFCLNYLPVFSNISKQEDSQGPF